MKAILISALVSLFFVGCTKDNENFDILKDGMVIDVDQALKKATDRNGCNKSELPWLQDLLIKAEEDRTTKKYRGNYIGIISMIKHNGQTLFYTNFMMGSGGIAYYLFDCDGALVLIPTEGYNNKTREAYKKKNIIYASIAQ
jgi:hypothetical protein